MPVITICHESYLFYDLESFNIDTYDYVSHGKFSSGNISADTIYNRAVDGHTYILDESSKNSSD